MKVLNKKSSMHCPSDTGDLHISKGEIKEVNSKDFFNLTALYGHDILVPEEKSVVLSEQIPQEPNSNDNPKDVKKK